MITPRVLDALRVETVDDYHWKTLEEFRYNSDVAKCRLIVPVGFVTDFASVPRVPLVFLLTGDTAQSAAVLHDFLYTMGLFTKELSDEVFYEAMRATHVPAWRAHLMYWGVKYGGLGAWNSHRNA